MYDDDPQWRVMFNYLRAMYHAHPIRQDIAGTVESIAKITPDHLYRCYRTFYNLHNMAFVLAGSFDVDRVCQLLDQMLKPCDPVTVRRVFPAEPASVARPRVEEALSVALPLFQFGYKLPGTAPRGEKDLAAAEVLLEVLASEASPLFRRLLDSGLVNESSFASEFFEGEGYATLMFGGESNDPEAVAAAITEELLRLRKEGIDPAAFERSRRSLYGQNLAALNSTASIANAILSLTFKGRELFSYIHALAGITAADVEQFLAGLPLEQQVLSIVKPL